MRISDWSSDVCSSDLGADADVREAAIARASAEVVLEQSRATQDYTVGGGLRFMRETNDVALVAGLSIPLGRFDHNEANLERAQTEPPRLEAAAENPRLAPLTRPRSGPPGAAPAKTPRRA